jgi:hypothetical protein
MIETSANAGAHGGRTFHSNRWLERRLGSVAVLPAVVALEEIA